MQRSLKEGPSLQFARNAQFLADLRLAWPDFTFSEAKTYPCQTILALNGDTNPLITYCIATCHVP